MTKANLAKAVGISLILWLLLIMGVVALRSQAPPKEVKPIQLTAEEGRTLELLRSNLQEKVNIADAARRDYEVKVIEREQARGQVVNEFARLLQSKGGSLEEYDFEWKTKTFVPKKAQ